MNDIGDWSNDLAAGMFMIEQESEVIPIKGAEQG